MANRVKQELVSPGNLDHLGHMLIKVVVVGPTHIVLLKMQRLLDVVASLLDFYEVGFIVYRVIDWTKGLDNG